MKFSFIECQVEGYKNIFKLSCRPFALFTSYKAFLKNKKRSKTSLPASFPACVLKNKISSCILLADQISLLHFTLFIIFKLHGILGNTCIIIVC